MKLKWHHALRAAINDVLVKHTYGYASIVKSLLGFIEYRKWSVSWFEHSKLHICSKCKFNFWNTKLQSYRNEKRREEPNTYGYAQLLKNFVANRKFSQCENFSLHPNGHEHVHSNSSWTLFCIQIVCVRSVCSLLFLIHTHTCRTAKFMRKLNRYGNVDNFLHFQVIVKSNEAKKWNWFSPRSVCIFPFGIDRPWSWNVQCRIMSAKLFEMSWIKSIPLK